jgi:hypothetical protein
MTAFAAPVAWAEAPLFGTHPELKFRRLKQVDPKRGEILQRGVSVSRPSFYSPYCKVSINHLQYFPGVEFRGLRITGRQAVLPEAGPARIARGPGPWSVRITAGDASRAEWQSGTPPAVDDLVLDCASAFGAKQELTVADLREALGGYFEVSGAREMAFDASDAGTFAELGQGSAIRFEQAIQLPAFGAVPLLQEGRIVRRLEKDRPYCSIAAFPGGGIQPGAVREITELGFEYSRWLKRPASASEFGVGSSSQFTLRGEGNLLMHCASSWNGPAPQDALRKPTIEEFRRAVGPYATLLPQ